MTFIDSSPRSLTFLCKLRPPRESRKSVIAHHQTNEQRSESPNTTVFTFNRIANVEYSGRVSQWLFECNPAWRLFYNKRFLVCMVCLIPFFFGSTLETLASERRCKKNIVCSIFFAVSLWLVSCVQLGCVKVIHEKRRRRPRMAQNNVDLCELGKILREKCVIDPENTENRPLPLFV